MRLVLATWEDILSNSTMDTGTWTDRHTYRHMYAHARAYTHTMKNKKSQKKPKKIMNMYQGPKASEQAAQFIVVS